MKRFEILIVILVGCGDDPAVQPDAAAPDAPITMCPAQTATPLPPGNFKLYINTEGVDLTPGQDNAPTNTSSLVPNTVTVPAFYPNDTSRQASIEVIVGYAQRALAPYSIDVVLQRPTSGDYYMAVMGGTSQAIIGTPNVLSVAPGVCDFTNRNRVSLIFDLGSNPPQYYATTILSDFGALLGMAVTEKANDCMCRQGQVCAANGGLLCTYGVDVPVNQMSNHCGLTTQNEVRHLVDALGCR